MKSWNVNVTVSKEIPVKARTEDEALDKAVRRMAKKAGVPESQVEVDFCEEGEAAAGTGTERGGAGERTITTW